jgi:single-stranded DNA-binding protein
MEIAKEILEQIQSNESENGDVKYSKTEIRNKVDIVGTIDTEISLAYKIHEEGIYKFVLKVPRLRKDVFDFLNVEIPERGMNINNYKTGDKVRITGQFRSSNRKEEGESKSHLYLNIFAESIEPESTNSKINEVKLHGHLCREPHFRVTPNGREICDLLLAINRNYDRCDYIPCITWGRDAKFAKEFNTGQGFYIIGRLQSRNYRKRISDDEVIERTAYEVSVSEIRETQEGEVITETRYLS